MSGQKSLCVGSWSYRRAASAVGHDPIAEGWPASGTWPSLRWLSQEEKVFSKSHGRVPLGREKSQQAIVRLET
eukprot:3568432-Pyramimonas_sp.AAC.1